MGCPFVALMQARNGLGFFLSFVNRARFFFLPIIFYSAFLLFFSLHPAYFLDSLLGRGL